jgi:glutathione S-transferase
VFVDYARRMTDREAYRRAKDIDAKLTAELQPQQPQPA